MSVVWSLTYPVSTPSQATVLRHHLALLRDDRAVSRVEVSDSPERPGIAMVRVTFQGRCSRPERTEIQALNQTHSEEARANQLSMHRRLARGETLKKTWHEHILDED